MGPDALRKFFCVHHGLCPGLGESLEGNYFFCGVRFKLPVTVMLSEVIGYHSLTILIEEEGPPAAREEWRIALSCRGAMELGLHMRSGTARTANQSS